jgi:hypothetical protein
MLCKNMMVSSGEEPMLERGPTKEEVMFSSFFEVLTLVNFFKNLSMN